MIMTSFVFNQTHYCLCLYIIVVGRCLCVCVWKEKVKGGWILRVTFGLYSLASPPVVQCTRLLFFYLHFLQKKMTTHYSRFMMCTNNTAFEDTATQLYKPCQTTTCWHTHCRCHSICYVEYFLQKASYFKHKTHCPCHFVRYLLSSFQDDSNAFLYGW